MLLAKIILGFSEQTITHTIVNSTSLGLRINWWSVDIFLPVLVLNCDERIFIFRSLRFLSFDCAYLLLDVDSEQWDDHKGGNSDDNNPNDFLFLLFIFVNVLHFDQESEIIIWIMGGDIDHIGLGNILDLEGNVLVDLKFGDIVSIHVCEEESVHSMSMESESYFKGVVDSPNT